MKASIIVEADFDLNVEDTQLVLTDIVESGILNADREYQRQRWPKIKRCKILIIPNKNTNDNPEKVSEKKLIDNIEKSINLQN